MTLEVEVTREDDESKEIITEKELYNFTDGAGRISPDLAAKVA